MIRALMDSSARTNDTIARLSISYNVASKESRAVTGTSKPLVSVVIPTYNRAALLDEALSSAGAQEGAGLTFHFPFLYAPGVVAVYPPRPDGLLVRASATGRHVENQRAAVEKALALLPDTAANRRFKQEARARTELHMATPMTRAERWDLTRSLLLGGLTMFPDIVRAPRAE